MTNKENQESEKSQLKKLVFLQWGIIFLLAGFVLIWAVPQMMGWENAGWFSVSRPFDEKAPYHEEVENIIKNQRYSGLPALLRDDVYLDLDFEKREWTIQNLHRYEENGRAILEQGKYGVCGQLAYYTYHQVRPLFDHRYDIKFVRVSESQYFPVGKGIHFALQITDISKPFSPVTYILDPSFRRYSHIDDFEDYEFYETQDVLEFMSKRRPYEMHPVNTGTPIYIRKSHMLFLSVDETNGKYDKNNFTVTLSALKKHGYVSRGLFAIRKREGKVELRENKKFIDQLLPDDQYETLQKLATKFFNRLSKSYPST